MTSMFLLGTCVGECLALLVAADLEALAHIGLGGLCRTWPTRSIFVDNPPYTSESPQAA